MDGLIAERPGRLEITDDAAPAAPSSARQIRRSLLVASSLAVDLLAVVAAYLICWAIRIEPRGSQPLAISLLSRTTLITVPLWLVVFASYDLYDRRALSAASEEARRLFQAVAVSIVGVVIVTFALKLPVSRSWVASLWVTSMVTVGFTRLVMRRVLHRLHARGVLTTPSVIVGTNDEARTIARCLARQRWLGYAVVGFVSVEPPERDLIDGWRVLGTIDEISEVVDRFGARAVLVAGTAIRAEQLLEIDQKLQATDAEIRISPGMPHVSPSRIRVRPLDGFALLALDKRGFPRSQATVKRACDLVGATIAFLVALPLMLFVAAAVKLGSRGPVLFSQCRVGKDGTPFVIYKFRSMVADAEERLLDIGADNLADGILFKVRDDPRVTRIGRVIRRWGVDELPQLINVLKGDMSLVGPRPALPSEAERYSQEVRARLRVKPGVTGLWQVNGRHELSFDDYVRYDVYYVENWSLGLDLYVLGKTLPALLGRRGAY